MSDDTKSYKKHTRQPNLCRESRMSLHQGKSIGPYEILDLLKEGSYSKIYLAKSKFINEKVAIKAIKKSHINKNLEDLLLITKQIETLKILKHRNIVSLYEIYESNKYIYLVTEYLSGKDLIEKLIKKKRFNEEEALRIFFQLLDALTYMHKMSICHLNLRAEHILFDKNNRPKIVGFGYSTFYEKDKNIEGGYGSLCYACPEIIDEAPFNPELADVWSLGVILYVLICGYLPFSDEDDNKNKILISNAKIDFPKEMSNKLKDLLRHMLDKNPKKRYTFQKIVKHPWLKPYTEKIFSEGINICKTIFPVDERILNIINEYGIDKDKVKNDLIMNKYNIYTGLFKQIVRKLLDLKIKNISDLWSEEFMSYRDDAKNKYEDGDKKYEDYIKKIDEKYKKKEDYVNDFKEREDYVVERLVYLKDKKEEEKKDNLKVIDEAIIDIVDEEDNENETTNKSENENENELKQKTHDEEIQKNSIKNVKSERKKLFPKTKTPMFNFRELMSARRNNANANLLNSENIEIIYNKDQDVDIIQQFQEEQNKKISENIIIEKPTMKRSPSTPNFGKGSDTNKDNAPKTNPFKLSITPEKKDNLAKKILEQEPDNNSIYNKDIVYSIKSNNNNFKGSIYSNKNSIYSNISHINNTRSIYNGKNNNCKSIISGTIKKTQTNNNNDKSLFRMTCFRKTNNKNCLDTKSYYDDFLKKNHPDNVRKTMLKNSIFGKMKKIDEGNDDSESEKEKDENDEKDEKEIDAKDLKDSARLKYSLSFGDDDDDDEDEDGNNSIESKETDLKLFNILENENDEELQELKKIYFEDKADKDLKKSMIKKKSVRFVEDDKKSKEKYPESSLKKSNLSQNTYVSKNSNSFIDKYEEKLDKISKMYKIANDKDESGPIKFTSQLEISFNDDDGKFKINYPDDSIIFKSDQKTIKQLDFLKKEESDNNIDNIAKSNQLVQKSNIINKPQNINVDIDKIHKIFAMKNENKQNSVKKVGEESLNNRGEENSKDKNIAQKEEESTQTNINEYPCFIITEKIKQDSFSIYPDKNDDSKYNYFSNNTYNGNPSIEMEKYKIPLNENTYTPNTINYDLLINNNINSPVKGRNVLYPEKNYKNENKENSTLINSKSYSSFSYYPNKDNKINKSLKKYYYKNEDSNVDQSTLKINTSKYLKPKKSPDVNTESNAIKKQDNLALDKANDIYNINNQIQKFKLHYQKYENMTNNMVSKEENKLPKTLINKKGFKSVKNIKNEVIVKRNEIIEKIQHCQNLLNSIIKEKRHFMTHNNIKDKKKFPSDNFPKTFSYNKKADPNDNNDTQRQKSKKKLMDMKKNTNNISKFAINNDNNCSNEVRQIYSKNNNENNFEKGIKYQKKERKNSRNSINNKDNDKSSNNILMNDSIDNKNNSLTSRAVPKKEYDNNILFHSKQLSNYSFDTHQKQISNIKEDEQINPNKKLIRLYQKYENDNKEYINNDKNQLKENGSFNKTYNSNFNKNNENDYINYQKNKK